GGAPPAPRAKNLYKKPMTWRLLAAVAVVLVQACAGAPPPPEAPQESQAAVVAAPPTPPVVQPAPPAGSGVLDTAKLPPFEGERQEVSEPLRGVRKVDRTAPVDDLWQRVRSEER